MGVLGQVSPGETNMGGMRSGNKLGEDECKEVVLMRVSLVLVSLTFSHSSALL